MKSKRLLILFCMLCLCLSLAFVSASATTIVDGGMFGADGNNLTWELYENGTLCIYGTGSMGDSMPWLSHYTSIKQVILMEGITDISNTAFSDCANLVSITIPSSVTDLGSWTFSNCSSLQAVTIPTGVTQIDTHTFAGCSSLTSVTLPDTVTTIGNGAFSDCSALVEITIPASVTNIDHWAFSGCSALTEVTVPDGIAEINMSVFRSCTALKRVNLPEQLTAINNFAFYECRSLEEISIPKSVTIIGRCAFDTCTSLKEVVIPNSVSVIDYCAFFGCTSLTSMVIPDGVIEIGEAAFYECTGLTEVFLPSSLTTIGTLAFQGCTELTHITIPEHVTVLEDQAFYDCSALKTITFLGDPPVIGDYSFGNVTAAAYYPTGNPLWTADVCKNYAGNITWYPNSTYLVIFRNWNDEVISSQEYCFGDPITIPADPVRLRQAASIVTQPKTTYTKLNGTAKVTVKAAGDGLTYTWYVKNAGATKYSKSSVTSATYSVKMTEKVKDRLVYCVVKDKYNKTVQTETVRLRQAASIVTQPKTTYTKLNGTAKVTVRASGDVLTYTWYFKNAGSTEFSKSSVTSATYSAKMTEKVKDRLVYCVVKDKYGKTVQTETVRLRMAASISKQPVSVTAAKGAKATVKLTALGDGLTYKWYYKDADGKTFKLTSTFKSSTYSLTMSKTNTGRQVYCVVTDKYGNSVKSNTVTLKMK